MKKKTVPDPEAIIVAVAVSNNKQSDKDIPECKQIEGIGSATCRSSSSRRAALEQTVQIHLCLHRTPKIPQESIGDPNLVKIWLLITF